jgi:hypothetical protein
MLPDHNSDNISTGATHSSVYSSSEASFTLVLTMNLDKESSIDSEYRSGDKVGATMLEQFLMDLCIPPFYVYDSSNESILAYEGKMQSYLDEFGHDSSNE